MALGQVIRYGASFLNLAVIQCSGIDVSQGPGADDGLEFAELRGGFRLPFSEWRNPMARKILVLCMGVGLALMPIQSHAEDDDGMGVRAGVLRCDVSSGFGFVFGSTRNVDCVFESVGGKRTESYAGRIARFGADIGYLNSGVILWGVFAPTGDVDEYALVGEYLGVGAEAAVGVGVGADVLIGGSTKSFSLQPLSIEGVTGLNVAAGITELRLKAPDESPE